MAEQYIYAVARVRSKELKLLTGQVFDALVSAASAQDAVKILADHGWGDGDINRIDEMLQAEREKTWSFIAELVPESTERRRKCR